MEWRLEGSPRFLTRLRREVRLRTPEAMFSMHDMGTVMEARLLRHLGNDPARLLLLRLWQHIWVLLVAATAAVQP